MREREVENMEFPGELKKKNVEFPGVIKNNHLEVAGILGFGFGISKRCM